MDWMQISLLLLGGLGLFLYGMHLMSDGLQRTAGNSLRKWLGKLTKNRILAVIAGIVVTAVIQSSTATSVMVVGFVNAGLIQLSQAVGVIMGANIGSTLAPALTIFNVAMYAPLAVFAGIVMLLFVKSKKVKSIGQIITGVGLLFLGMSIMTDAMRPLSGSEEFMQLIANAQVPIIGIIVGMLLTAILQTSAAVVVMLIALATAGAMDLSTGVFILFGTNIGTCLTALISAIGTTKTAKRTAVVHLLFNVIGTAIFTVIVLLPFGFVDLIENTVAGDARQHIVAMHVVFNVATTLMLLPFANQLVWMAKKIVKGEDKPREELRLLHITSKGFRTPSVALEQLKLEVDRMAALSLKTYSVSTRAFFEERKDLIEEVFANEEVINFLETEITRYLVKASVMDLSDADRAMVSSYYQLVSRIERVGDYSENIAEYAQSRIDGDITFSDEAISEIRAIASAAGEMLNQAVDVFSEAVYDSEALNALYKEERAMYEEVTQYKANHMERSKESVSERNVGMIFTNILLDMRRIVHEAGGIMRSLKWQEEMENL